MEVHVDIDDFMKDLTQSLAKCNDVAEIAKTMDEAKEFLMLCFAYRKRG